MPVEIRTYPVKIKGETLMLGIARDITERKRAEEALRQSEERYRTVVEHVGEGIIMADPTERITFANSRADGIFGVKAGGLVGRNLKEFLDAEQLAILQAQTALRQRGAMGAYELEIVRPDGANRSLLITATPKFDSETRFTGAFGIFRDITDRKRAEEERERLILDLREALASVRTLRGMLPICAACKKIRDDQGYWQAVEHYISEHSEAEFSHGLCPDCMKRLYPEFHEEDESVASGSNGF